MKRTTTPDYCHLNDLNADMWKEKESARLQPKKQTLDFLMRFARSYYAEKQLPKEISGMILN